MGARGIIFVLAGTLLAGAFGQRHQFQFVNSPLNWTDAQSVCRRDFTDLATTVNAADVDAVRNAAAYYAGKAWIGLLDDPELGWRWSLSDSAFYAGGETLFRNWFPGQPDSLNGQQFCVSLRGGSPFVGAWDDLECSFTQQFVCYNGTVNDAASFIICDESLNWTEAQRHCRENFVDLASIRNVDENAVITNLTIGRSVWIGLYRHAQWSDGSQSSFQGWASGQPDSYEERCVAADFTTAGQWSDENCSLELPFICYTTVPQNAQDFQLVGQNQSGVTLQWSKISDNISFVLSVNGVEMSIAAPSTDGPITYTVSGLSAGTNYTFTLFSVFESVRSSGVQVTAATDAPPPTCTDIVCPSHLDCITVSGTAQCVDPCERYSALNDDWRSVNNTDSSIIHCDQNVEWDGWYRMFLGPNNAQIPVTCVAELRCGTHAPMWITEPNPTRYNEIVTRTVCNAWSGSCCQFTSHTIKVKRCFGNYYVYKLKKPSACTLAYCAAPLNDFRATGQNETSITLQWEKMNNASFILQFEGFEANISAPEGDVPVVYTVSSLSPGTKYTFTLLYVIGKAEILRSQLQAATALQNAEMFNVIGKTDTSITFQWTRVSNASYVLQFGIRETILPAPDGDGPITFTVSSLSAATEYTFTLFSVYENIRSSGVQLTAVTDRQYVACGQTSCQYDMDCITVNGTAQCVDPCERYTALSDDWRSVNNSVVFIDYQYGKLHCDQSLQWDGWYRMFLGPNNAQIPETCVAELRCGTHAPMWITEPNPTQYNEIVARTVCNAWSGSCCQFPSHTIKVKRCFENYFVYKLEKPSNCWLAYCAEPQFAFRALRQNETSITLQWEKMNNNVSFVLQFNDTQTNISAPEGDGLVSYTISSLSPGTKYTFTLLYVIKGVETSRSELQVVTTPQNAQDFRSVGQNQSSVTLQWSKRSDDISFVLSVNGVETRIAAPSTDGPITYTVSGLSAGTNYVFTLFSVFESVRSSGVQVTAATDAPPPTCADLVCSSHMDCITVSGTAQCVDPCERYSALSDDWRSVNNSVVYIDYQYGKLHCDRDLQWDGWYRMFLGPNNAQIPETCVAELRCGTHAPMWITEPNPTQYNEIVTRTVCNAWSGSCCLFTTHTIKVKRCFGNYFVYKLEKPSTCWLAYCSEPQFAFRASDQNETSITLQWEKMTNISFILQFNGTQTNISAPEGDGLVSYTISSLSPGTKYTFILLYVIKGVEMSRSELQAVTTPRNAEDFQSVDQNQSSITLQWYQKSGISSFVLGVNGEETSITAPSNDGPISYTVSGLSAGTNYTFTLISVFEKVRSGGVQVTAATDDPPPTCADIVCPSHLDCITVSGTAQCVDPCERYSALNDDWRSVNNTDSSTTHCDQSLEWDGWYRMFLGPNNAQIPETCVAEYRCGTHVPMWITEPNPTQYNEIVTRTVCNTWGGSCCQFTTHTIKVKRCFGNYFVYKLEKPSACWLAYCAAPLDQDDFRVVGQDETSVTLQWNKVTNVTFILYFNGTQTNISTPAGNGPVTYRVSSLSPGTKYIFTLLYMSENIQTNRVQIEGLTAPKNVAGLKALGRSETSITLRWETVYTNTGYVLQFNEESKNFNLPGVADSVEFTVSNLIAATRYTFTLFSVFENVRSSGISISAVTAPQNAKNFQIATQNETSVTLQWDKFSKNVSFVLNFNGTVYDISSPVGNGPVTFTIPALTAASMYPVTLYSVFENVRSTGISIRASTGPDNVLGLQMRLNSQMKLSESELQEALLEFFREQCELTQFSLKIIKVQESRENNP